MRHRCCSFRRTNSVRQRVLPIVRKRVTYCPEESNSGECYLETIGMQKNLTNDQLNGDLFAKESKMIPVEFTVTQDLMNNAVVSANEISLIQPP